MKHLFKFALACLLASTTSQVLAQYSEDCEYVLSEYSYWIEYDSSYAAEYKSKHPACFGGGGADASQSISATTFTQALAISQNISARLGARQGGGPLARNGGSGLAAGGAPQAWNVWGSLGQSNTDTDYRANANRIVGSSDVQNSILGVDYALNPAMVVGLSVAFDDGDGSSRNVTGAGPKLGNSTDGYVIAPYLGYQISQEWAVDVSAGLGQGDFSAGGGVTADIDRWFAAANLNYARWVNNWQFVGKASYLHGEEEYGTLRAPGAIAVAGSTNKVDQLRIGAQAGYWMNGIMPYAGLSYSSNISRSGGAASDPTGRDAFIATLGLNFFSLSSKVTGGVMYEQELNRSNSDNNVLTANINFRF